MASESRITPDKEATLRTKHDVAMTFPLRYRNLLIAAGLACMEADSEEAYEFAHRNLASLTEQISAEFPHLYQ